MHVAIAPALHPTHDSIDPAASESVAGDPPRHDLVHACDYDGSFHVCNYQLFTCFIIHSRVWNTVLCSMHVWSVVGKFRC